MGSLPTGPCPKKTWRKTENTVSRLRDSIPSLSLNTKTPSQKFREYLRAIMQASTVATMNHFFRRSTKTLGKYCTVGR